MHGYGSHTFMWVNEEGEQFLVKYHWRCDQGIKNLTPEAAHQLEADDPDYATRDLYDSIENGEHPSWTLKAQILPLKEAEAYKWDVYDVTKVWPQGEVPLVEIGRMTLNKNPENYFSDIEQVAFSPSNMVPGVEPSNDKMLQGRLFSYPDTQRHRLGPNFDQIPVNSICPYAAKNNYERDGPMVVEGNQGVDVVYEPNTEGGPIANPEKAWSQLHLHGKTGRFEYPHANSDYT